MNNRNKTLYLLKNSYKEERTMTKVCPINQRKINENIARSNAVLTFLFVSIFLISGNWLFVLLVAIDFATRAFYNAKFSFFKKISTGVNRLVGTKEVLIDSGPKEFAAKIGFFLSTLIVLLFLVGFLKVALIISIILATFSFLEGVFGFCVACKIYPFLHAIKFSFSSEK